MHQHDPKRPVLVLSVTVFICVSSACNDEPDNEGIPRYEPPVLAPSSKPSEPASKNSAQNWKQPELVGEEIAQPEPNIAETALPAPAEQAVPAEQAATDEQEQETVTKHVVNKKFIVREYSTPGGPAASSGAGTTAPSGNADPPEEVAGPLQPGEKPSGNTDAPEEVAGPKSPNFDPPEEVAGQ